MLGTLRFHLRKDRINKKGNAPIEIFYSIAGVRQYTKSGLAIKPCNWDTNTYRAVYYDKKSAKKIFPEVDWKEFLTNTEVEDINHELNKIEAVFVDIEKTFGNAVITSADVMAKYKEGYLPKIRGAEPDIRTNFFDFVDNYIRIHRTARSEGSIKVYGTLKKHLERYEQHRGSKIRFDDIDYNFMAEFRHFLLTTEHVKLYKKKGENEFGKPVKYRMNDTTIAKQLTTLKTFLSYATDQLGINISENYKKFKIKHEKLSIIALTSDELKQMIEVELPEGSPLDKSRDLFVFGALTGLRVSDLLQLKPVHIKDGFITITVKKTKATISVPLTPKAVEILDKYKDSPTPLPVMSSQKINLYLKEVGKLAGIDKPTEKVSYYGSKAEYTTLPKYKFLSIHVARKTFASVAINKGVSTAIVKEIGGWVTERAFSRYTDINNETKKQALNNVFDF